MIHTASQTLKPSQMLHNLLNSMPKITNITKITKNIHQISNQQQSSSSKQLTGFFNQY
ncbi:hypothetical protein Hanom_Chr00s075562g01791031 [Helianthus anomalus]